MKTFINENVKKQKKVDAKRVIIGPGQAKKAPVQKFNDDILGLDLLGTNNTQNQQQNIMTFDQLLGNSNTTAPKNSIPKEYNDLI